jgi:hypothetical protein
MPAPELPPELPIKYDLLRFRNSGYDTDQLLTVAGLPHPKSHQQRTEVAANYDRLAYVRGLFPPDKLPALNEVFTDQVARNFIANLGIPVVYTEGPLNGSVDLLCNDANQIVAYDICITDQRSAVFPPLYLCISEGYGVILSVKSKEEDQFGSITEVDSQQKPQIMFALERLAVDLEAERIIGQLGIMETREQLSLIAEAQAPIDWQQALGAAGQLKSRLARLPAAPRLKAGYLPIDRKAAGRQMAVWEQVATRATKPALLFLDLISDAASGRLKLKAEDWQNRGLEELPGFLGANLEPWMLAIFQKYFDEHAKQFNPNVVVEAGRIIDMLVGGAKDQQPLTGLRALVSQRFLDLMLASVSDGGLTQSDESAAKAEPGLTKLVCLAMTRENQEQLLQQFIDEVYDKEIKSNNPDRRIRKAKRLLRLWLASWLGAQAKLTGLDRSATLSDSDMQELGPMLDYFKVKAQRNLQAISEGQGHDVEGEIINPVMESFSRGV